MKDKVIPIKYGGPHANVEAYANRETSQVEEKSWDENPSNEFCRAGAGKGDRQRPGNRKAYDETYVRVFGHE
jgi:hypothetical protein